MGIIDNTYRTVSCSKCDKTVTFNMAEFQTPDGNKSTMEVAPWIRTYRVVNTVLDGRNFGYCSDECELKGVETGEHNPVLKNVIEMPTGTNLAAIKQAAAEAAARAEGTRRLKAGEEVNIQPGR